PNRLGPAGTAAHAGRGSVAASRISLDDGGIRWTCLHRARLDAGAYPSGAPFGAGAPPHAGPPPGTGADRTATPVHPGTDSTPAAAHASPNHGADSAAGPTGDLTTNHRPTPAASPTSGEQCPHPGLGDSLALRLRPVGQALPVGGCRSQVVR